MNVCFAVAPILLFLPFTVRAETMVASGYAASASDVATDRMLPIGTRLVLANQRNDWTARVVVGMRGPFVRGSALDISSALARRLCFAKNGVLRLETRVIRP
jgi:rare lipoprotein A (peptidoglycan hydrolase)